MLSYDAALREMVYDKRSKPTERTKTEEEIAFEEKERLETLEKERLRRMRGEEVDVVEDTSSKRPVVRREGDDLDDDFIPDEGEEDLYGLGKGALVDTSDQEGEDVSEEEEEGGESVEDEDEESEESEDEFDLAEYFTDEEVNGVADLKEAESESETETEIVPATKRLRLAESSSTTKELAYTYPCPAAFDELLNITQEIPTESISIVIARIETLYSLKLRAENREKLEVFDFITPD
jgi:nucleolar protein 14